MNSGYANIVDSNGHFIQGLGRMVGGVSVDGSPVRPDVNTKPDELAQVDIKYLFTTVTYDINTLVKLLQPYNYSIAVGDRETNLPRSKASSLPVLDALEKSELRVTREKPLQATKLQT